MSAQYVSILPIFQKLSLRLRKQFILNCPKDFIQFRSECLVNLLRGELRDLRKEDVVKYRKEISEITQKRTPLHKTRIILGSTKGLQLISIIIPFVIKGLTYYGKLLVLIPYPVYQSRSTLQRKQKLEQKQEKEEIVPKNFDSVYSAVNARLKTSNNKHTFELILNSPKIQLSQSDKIILDNRETKESIVDFVCAIKRKNTDFPDIYFTILEATQLPPKLVINKNVKAKDRATWIPFKI